MAEDSFDSWKGRETVSDDRRATEERETLIDQTVEGIIEAVKVRFPAESGGFAPEEGGENFSVAREYNLETGVEEISITFSLRGYSWKNIEDDLQDIAKDKTSERLSVSFKKVGDEPAKKSIFTEDEESKIVDVLCRIDYRAPETVSEE